MAKNPLFGKDIISVDQFVRADIQIINTQAQKMRRAVQVRGGIDLLHGKVLTALFYEPSSRTFASFLAAISRLGGSFIPLQGMVYSSVAKGESLSDTVKTFSCYSDAIVIRHPELGSAAVAAQASEKPVINAGDGVGEHPTQALLDVFTISDHFRKLDNLEITMVGDLLNGRTVHSLAKILSLFPKIRLNLVSPDMLRMPSSLRNRLIKQGVKLNETEMLKDVVKTTDVFYITRIQKERFTDLNNYEKLKHFYIITPEVLENAKRTSIVMHPLPRVGEIAETVDSDKRAVYLREQMQNGMFVRMALLSLILNK